MFPWIYGHILTIIIASPLVGIFILMLLPKKYEDAASEVSLVSSGLTLFLSAVMFTLFHTGGRFLFSESYKWIPYLGSSYRVAVDGLSALLILAVALVTLISVLINWRGARAHQRDAFASLLAFELGLIGFFSSTDILLMYIFMETAVIFLGVSILSFRGGLGSYLMKYIGFMSASSILFLVVITFLMIAAGSADLVSVERIVLEEKVQIWMLILLVIGCLCRMGIFPFHGWVHELNEGSFNFGLNLTGLLFISGGYFFYRLLAPFAYALILLQTPLTWFVLSVILISAMIAFAQKSFGELLIYIIMAHFGLAFLGFISGTPQGFAGAGMQMVVLAAMLSAISVMFAIFKKRGVNLATHNLKGIFAQTPVLGLSFLIMVLALAGLPGLSNFPGLFMIWMGLFKGSWVVALVSLLGMVVVAAALIRSAGLALHGGDVVDEKQAALRPKGVLFIIPFVLLILVIGIFPDIILKYVKQSTEAAWIIFSRQM